MKRKCFISSKTEDFNFKEYIQQYLDVDMIDKSLNIPINSVDEDYIMRKIREEYLHDTTVTIHLIGLRSAETLGWDEQKFIKRELQASLYHGVGNSQNGILGVVLPDIQNAIFGNQYYCPTCGNLHNTVRLDDSTVVKELSYNYYIPQDTKCAWSEDDRYCIITSWEDFQTDPNKYIELAFLKRFTPIAEKTKVRP